MATHPDTLLVVTGDHETGGLSVEEADTADESGDDIPAEDGPFTVCGSDKEFYIDWTSSGHTSVAVPVTVAGPLADEFTGKHQNTFVYDVLKQILTRR
jgi:alkaline phosphatase